MNRRLALLIFAALSLQAQPNFATFPLDSTAGLQPHNIKIDTAKYLGRTAVHVAAGDQMDALIIVPHTFRNGTIELEVAGKPAAGAAQAARGFIGLAFHLAPDAARYECFYLRPTNGRADDQLRRNHSVQYVSEPDYPWNRLRDESPGKYESYVDLEPGVWTKIRIVVAGRNAQLFVHGAAQPCLIVNDLKLGESEGLLALWAGPGTDGYFSNLRVAK